MAAAHLEDVSTDDLIKEVQRRIECATKPEKHVVLIGNLAELALHQCLVCRPLRPSIGLLDATVCHVHLGMFCRSTRLWKGNTVAKDKARALPMPSGHW